MKIVVLDGYTLNPGDLTWKQLEKNGDLTIYDRTPEDKIVERMGDAEIALINKVPMKKETLKQLPNLKYIGVLATGYNVVDIEATKELGIVVTNIPAYGTEAVAQMVFAHLLEITNHVALHNRAVKDGEWTNNIEWCFWKKPLMELTGKTMGIIGYGRIGQATSNIAQAFGMKVLVYARHSRKELESPNLQYVELEELFAKSDVISLHCPLTESTRGMINKDSIAKMKEEVIIINTARGPLIVEEDLAEALNTEKVLAAGMDVVSTEPIAENNPLLKAQNAFITPHIAWAPKETRQRLMNIAVNNVKEFMAGTPINVVNSQIII